MLFVLLSLALQCATSPAVEAPPRAVRLTAGLGVTARSEQLAELLNRKTGITNDTAKGEGIHRVVTRDGQDASATGHDDVLALTHDYKARLLQGAHGIKMVDARDLWKG